MPEFIKFQNDQEHRVLVGRSEVVFYNSSPVCRKDTWASLELKVNTAGNYRCHQCHDISSA